MPYPSQITADGILQTARDMVEAEGVEQLSMHKLAGTLGVKAPSLYRYFEGKTSLLRALNLHTAQQMVAAMQQIPGQGSDPAAQLTGMAQALRGFAHANPRCYALAFSNTNPELRPDEQVLEQLVIPIQHVMALISGKQDSLAALRGLWALLHGFILLELSEQFRRGGDLDLAFHQALAAYLRGWQGYRSQE